MTINTHRNKHKVVKSIRTTQKKRGGVGNFGAISKEKEEKTEKKAKKLIVVLLQAKKEGKDIIEFTDGNKKVKIGDEKLNQRDICYIIAELTGLSKMKKNYTLPAGNYEGYEIGGKLLRNTEDLVNGVHRDGKEAVGLKDLINKFADIYYVKYLDERAPLQTGLISQVLEIHPADADINTPNPLLETIMDKFASEELASEELTKVVEEPIVELSLEEPIELVSTSVVREIAKDLQTEPQLIPEDIPLDEQPAFEEPVKPILIKKFNIMLDNERKEYELNKTDTSYDYLYPELNDPNFNIKIAQRKEFNDTQYDGTIHDIKSQTEKLCNADFELAPHQQFVRNFLSFQTPYNSLLLYNGLGTGKCHKRDTPIIMADGSIKMVQDIIEGDFLMGDDSTPRTVLSLASGRDKMYDIIPDSIQKGGETYTVNQEHILCLKMSGYPRISYNNVDTYYVEWIENNTFCSKTFTSTDQHIAENFLDTIQQNTHTNSNIIEIAVKDYLQLPDTTRELLKGYKVPIEFPERELPFDPYTIGYWLGDGTCRDNEITSQVSTHIPHIYKCNSRENRLKLLAGLIDSGVNYEKNDNDGIEFTLKNKPILDDVIYLVRSLGFSCYKENQSESAARRITINGQGTKGTKGTKGIEEIPTKIPRVQAVRRKQIKDALVTGITIKYVGEDDYYGFTLDKNCRYLMGDFTVTHNTCSSIGIAEEMRSYMKQLGLTQKIMVISSPNVEINYRQQLFDENKLKNENGVWSLNTCIGNSLIKEINPTNLRGMPKERVVSQINSIINNYYVFMGYIEFANYATRHILVKDDDKLPAKERERRKIKRIRRYFENRLIIVDEVHNIRIADDNNDKRAASLLMMIARHTNNLRLLLLSATPMYNSYKEIIWLTNLLNINDKRPTIQLQNVFEKDGTFKAASITKDGAVVEDGKELLKRKTIGYVSYVRGENPYTFPYRIYPNDFAPEYTITNQEYPKYQMNKKPIQERLSHVPVYVSAIGEYQQKGYDFIMEVIRNKQFVRNTAEGKEYSMPSFENMESFGYDLLQVPLEALNIVYPSSQLTDYNALNILNGPSSNDDDEFHEGDSEIVANMVGKRGLSNIMTYANVVSPKPIRYNFEYKPEVLEKYGNIFNPKHIGKYSNKISKICDCVMNSNGIVLIYSQYIDGGLVPVALALEELGFTRFGSDSVTKPLFKKAPCEPIDAVTLLPKSKMVGKSANANTSFTSFTSFKPAKYVMITGDKAFSPDNNNDIKYITDHKNKNGEFVKVVLISKAAAEGLDFKNIRQIHILEPWYHMNRIEQIIGRGVRNLSHCSLPFEQRNVEIYLHATLPRNEEEPADLYVYRIAEKKAMQIGKVTRLLKENAVDCILNIGQTNFTVDKMMALTENQNIEIHLASRKTIQYKIGDKPFTDVCDYMDNCNFQCSPHAEIKTENIITDTYNNEFIKTGYDMILKRIRQLYREHSLYTKTQLFQHINVVKKYPDEQIYYALSQFIDNKNEYLIDKYGRSGYLINKEEYYAFQPIEITSELISMYDIIVPVDYKRESIFIELPKTEEQIKAMGEPVKTLEYVKTGEPLESLEPVKTVEYVKPDTDIPVLNTYDEIVNELDEILASLFKDDEDDEDDEKEAKETDWYFHAKNVIHALNARHGISNLYIRKYTIHHYLDCLPVKSKVALISRLYNEIDGLYTDTENQMKAYFDTKILRFKSLTGIVLSEQGDYKFYVKNIDIENPTLWNEARPTEVIKLKSVLQESSPNLVISRERIHPLFGFMSVFKKQDVVFKIKDLTQKRNNKGSRCDNLTKTEIIKRINTVLQKDEYTETNAATILKYSMCVILEVVLRHFNELKPERLWFFDIDMAAINDVQNI